MTTTIEQDTRSEYVAGLRKLADFIERNGDLPSPVAATVYAHGQSYADVVAFAADYGARLVEWKKADGAHWMAVLELATVDGCQHVEYVMTGSETDQ